MSKTVIKLAEEVAHDPAHALADTLQQLKQTSEEAGDRAEQAIEKAARAIARAANRLGKDARRKGAKLAKKTKRDIEAHPVASTAIVAAAVALATLLVARQFAKSSRD